VTLVIVHVIISYFFVTDGRGRRASLAYLRRVHDLTASFGARPGLWQSFLHYRMFALSIFDRVAFWLGRDDQFELAFNGEELFSRIIDEGRGAIIVGSHLGSFDSMRLLAHRADVAVNVLMFTDHAPLLNSIFRELSPDAEMNVIRADPSSMKTAFEVRSRIERGELVAILADRIDSFWPRCLDARLSTWWDFVVARIAMRLQPSCFAKRRPFRDGIGARTLKLWSSATRSGSSISVSIPLTSGSTTTISGRMSGPTKKR
jgi:predicted LPLAT superfamily acyltransferase